MKNSKAIVAAVLLVGSLLGGMQAATAASHALVLWIGDYPQGNSLPGIEKDAIMAKAMAKSMGISEDHITEVSNKALTTDGIRMALEGLTQRINQGDQVFIYYSGHGTQAKGPESGKCSEGMVAVNLKTFDDSQLEPLLQNLAQKAGQVVMFNDSCFSGGQATKALYTHDEGFYPKVLPAEKLAGEQGAQDYACGNAINARSAKSAKSAMDRYGTNFLYVAASSDREVSFATNNGSAATSAWVHCLSSGTDSDKSGALSGEEIRQCAQDYLAGANPWKRRFNQNISMLGNSRLPLSFVATTVAQAPTQAIRAEAAFNDLKSASNSKIQVQLKLANDRLKINHDHLSFQVTTQQEGYLYVLYSAPDGKQVDLLYPNAKAANNLHKAGVHTFPGRSWALRSSGPEGTGYLIALLAEKPLEWHLKGEGAGMALTNATAQKLLTVTGSENAHSYGASAVIAVTEVP